MTNNPIDPKKKINPNQEPDQLSDEQLEAVAGGGIVGEAVDAVKDFVGDVYQAGKDLVSDIKEIR